MRDVFARFGASALLGLCIVAAAVPARADAETRRYEVAAGLRPIERPHEDPLGVTTDGSLEIGAVYFDSIGGEQARDVTVRAFDDVNPWGQVFLIVCQDLDANFDCAVGSGDPPDEPRVAGCVRGDGTGNGLRMREVPTDVPIIVRVFAFWGCDVLIPDALEGPAGATTGAISLSY